MAGTTPSCRFCLLGWGPSFCWGEPARAREICPMLSFCLHSVFHAYGWRFFWHVALPHPLSTLRALASVRRLDDTGERMDVPSPTFEGVPSLVGVGFCLKPLACPSGRFNHDCRCLEALQPSCSFPACCRICDVRLLGEAALEAGAAFTIMTSARDILYDVLLPALKGKRFPTGLFLLCRYSFLPFAFGMLVSGIRGRLLPFESGDCRDYRTWHRADVGIKDEQTRVSDPVRQMIQGFGATASGTPLSVGAEQTGGVFYPVPARSVRQVGKAIRLSGNALTASSPSA